MHLAIPILLTLLALAVAIWAPFPATNGDAAKEAGNILYAFGRAVLFVLFEIAVWGAYWWSLQ